MARIPYPADPPADLVESQRPDELPEEYQHLNQQAARNVYRVLAHEPELIAGLREYIGVTWDRANISDRQRELVILGAATGLESEYEWHQHVRIGLLEGMTPEELRAIASQDLQAFGDTEATLVRYAHAAARREVTDELLDALQAAFDVETVTGITTLVGAYVALATHIDALGVETEEPFVGWDLAGLEND